MHAYIHTYINYITLHDITLHYILHYLTLHNITYIHYLLTYFLTYLHTYIHCLHYLHYIHYIHYKHYKQYNYYIHCIHCIHWIHCIHYILLHFIALHTLHTLHTLHLVFEHSRGPCGTAEYSRICLHGHVWGSDLSMECSLRSSPALYAHILWPLCTIAYGRQSLHLRNLLESPGACPQPRA